MLTQLSQSSKRFGKLKKYKSKLKQSGFQFLLQSLDRGKENYVPNAQLDNQLVHSVHIDPLLTAPVHSSTLNSSTIIQNSKKGNFFLQNVKMLDRSDASISETCAHNNSKKSKKHKENSNRSKIISKKENKNSNQIQSNNSSKVQKSVIEQLISKTKQYMTVFNQLNSRQEHLALKRSKKIQKIQSELVALITSIQEQQLQQRRESKLCSSINTTKFSIWNGESLKAGKGNQVQYLKKINSLQYQKEKLHSLISQHQIANIKMFVKINQGQSQEIQLYKKQLAMLFEKYKKLESIILSDKRKMNELIKQKQYYQLKNKELTLQNTQLMKSIKQYQQQANKRQNLVSQGQRHKKNGNLSSLQPHISHSRQKSSQSIFESSINDRGELYLQSIINSDFQSENGFGSSLTTYTSRIPGKDTKIGINLTSLFQSMKNQNLRKMMQDPSKIKKMLNECRNSIVSLQNVIKQQNKQLEYSLTALQENSEKLKENQILIKSLESGIVTLTKSLEKQRQKNQQKLKEKLKLQQIQANRKKSANEIKFLKNSLGCEEKQLKKKMSVDENKKVKVDFQIKNTETDQYRIIALQAKALEKMLGNHYRFVNQ